MEEYVSKATIKTIKASSRMSVNIDKNYFTVEYTEERALPNDCDYDIYKEREALWESCNSQCDEQIQLIYQVFKK